MQARRATALLLTCLLSLCLVTAPRIGHGGKHPAHAVALLTAATPDAPQSLRQLSVDTTTTSGAWTAVLRPGTGTSDTSQRASERTADAALIRGPPGQGRF